MSSLPPLELPKPAILAEATFSGVTTLGNETFQANFQLTAETPFVFLPGQYIWIVLPTLKYEDPRGNRRAFSLINGPKEQNSISILSKNTQSGFKQTLLELSLGDRLRVSGPFGSSYVIAPGTVAPRLLLAINSGIAPFLSLLRHAISQPIPTPLTLIHYYHGQEYEHFHRELRELTAEHSQLQVIPKQTRIGWGDIPHELQHQLITNHDSAVFISGGQIFVDEMTQLMVSNQVPPTQLHYEEFYPKEYD